MKTVTREEALALGLKRYYTGTPCKNGHLAERKVGNFTCVECHNAAARRNHNPAEAYAKQKAYYAANPDKQTKRGRKYREANEAQAKAYAAKYREENREKVLEGKKDYYYRNKHKYSTWNGTRRATRRNATPAWLTDQQKLEIEQKYLLAKIHEAVTGMAWEVDHVVPLKGKKICGLHVPWNLEVVLRTENRKKGNGHGD